MDTLLRERASLQSSNSIADGFSSAGNIVRDALRGQNAMLSGTNRNLTGIQGTFTSIDSIYTSIRRKYTRDCLILTLFTAFLCCFLLYWWLRS